MSKYRNTVRHAGRSILLKVSFGVERRIVLNIER